MSDDSPIINGNTYAGPERRSGKDRRQKQDDLWERRDF